MFYSRMLLQQEYSHS